MRERDAMLPLILATMLILAATLLPTSGYRAHPHWERVSWIPFADGLGKPWEMVANVLLFLPFGWAAARAFGSSRAVVLGCGFAGLMLSSGVELAQVFAHGRVPSATDVVLNVLGAVLGAELLMRAASGRQRPLWSALGWSRSSSHR